MHAKNCWMGIIMVCLFMAPAVPAFAGEYQEASADLDGDGVNETIVMKYSWDEGDFTLAIGDDEVKAWLEPTLLGFEIVDIDTDDGFMEVEVQTTGPSDDYQSIFYAYRDGHIIETGSIWGESRINGDGTVLADSWMGFWIRTDVHKLNGIDHILKEIPQDLYSVEAWTNEGDRITVIEPFPVYIWRDKPDVLVELEEGDWIQFLAYAPTPDENEEGYYHEWYLIVTSSGLTGWIDFWSVFEKIDGILVAD